MFFVLFQVYNSRSGCWGALHIEGHVEVPLDAVVSPSADQVLIIQDMSGTPYLTKCEKT